MSIPKDGYYIARVQLDTGGEHQRYVRVKGGKLHDEEGEELLPQACGDFNELSSVMIAWVWPEDVAMELEALRTANAGLVEKVAETQAALDLSARQLLDAVNDRNRIGVQLDLLRDELMRIGARIGETGLIGEHAELSSIAGYCERAQKDIAVLYTPIEERDRLQREVRKMDNLRERAEERARRLEEAGGELRKASWAFLLTHVDDDDGNEDAISIDQVDPESAVQWEDPPSAGEHVRLRNAINDWNRAKGQP